MAYTLEDVGRDIALWAGRKLGEAGAPVIVFRMVHPRREIEDRPERIASLMPGWSCVWKTLYDYDVWSDEKGLHVRHFPTNRVFLCMRPGRLGHPDMGDDEDYTRIVCDILGCVYGDAFATGIITPSYASAIVVPARMYSSETGSPEPLDLLLVHVDYSSRKRLVVEGEITGCLLSNKCYESLIEILHGWGSREAARLASTMRDALKALLYIGTDLDTLAADMVAKKYEPGDEVDVALVLEELAEKIPRSMHTTLGMVALDARIVARILAGTPMPS